MSQQHPWSPAGGAGGDCITSVTKGSVTAEQPFPGLAPSRREVPSGRGGIEKHTAGLQSGAGASKASSAPVSREDTSHSEDAQSGRRQEQVAVPLDATLLKMGFRSKSPQRQRE